MNRREILEAYRTAAQRAGAHYPCLNDGWDPQASPIASVEGDGADLTIRIQGPIDSWFGVDTSAIVQRLDAVEPRSISVLIDSPGGFVLEALTLYEDLRARAGNGVSVSTEVRSLAASAASLLLLAGDERRMSDAGTVMIHRPWGVMLAAGDADDLEGYSRRRIGGLRHTERNVEGIYAKRTGLALARLKSLMADETWMNAEEALRDGFTTETVGADDPDRDEPEAPSAEEQKRMQAAEEALDRHLETTTN